MTLVKICGITNIEDALAAVDAGADFLGFNFFRNSRRYISPEIAGTIIEQLPAKIATVGVFVNDESREVVADTAQRAGVKTLQLHGDETPEFCRSLTEWNVIKVFALGSDFDSARLEE